jgi:hypothetical protein
LAAAVLVLCCAALPLIVALGGAALATIGEVLLRYWPLTILGLGALVWAGVSVLRAMARPHRASGDRGGIPS